MGTNLRRRAADFVEEARRNDRQKRRPYARPFSELKQSWRQFGSFLGLCFSAYRFGFDPRLEVPFSFRLIRIFTCFEAVFHGRQNSADRATASRAPARSESLRQMIEEFQRHIACTANKSVCGPVSMSSAPFVDVTDYGKLAFFCHAFSWALLRANSCVRQLRSFCFPGSSLKDSGSLPECSRSLWKQKPSLLACPRKMGQEKGDILTSYSIVTWNSSGKRFVYCDASFEPHRS